MVVVERWPLVQVGQVGRLLEDDLIVPLSIGQVIFKSYCPSSSTCHGLFQERHSDKGCVMAAEFIHLWKHFKRVNHQLLVKKLSGYGIKNHELRWFENYLESVSICCPNGSAAQSASQQIKSGIPQGPIPCLMLFFIHISDLIAQLSTSVTDPSMLTPTSGK